MSQSIAVPATAEAKPPRAMLTKGTAKQAKAPAKVEAKAPRAKLAKAKVTPVTAFATALNAQPTTGGAVYVTYLHHSAAIDAVKNGAAKAREIMASVNPVFNDGKYKDATISFYLSVANTLQTIRKSVDTVSYEKAMQACSKASAAMSVTLVYHFQTIGGAKDGVSAMRAIMAKSKSKWASEAATIKASSMSTIITDGGKFLRLANA